MIHFEVRRVGPLAMVCLALSGGVAHAQEGMGPGEPGYLRAGPQPPLVQRWERRDVGAAWGPLLISPGVVVAQGVLPEQRPAGVLALDDRTGVTRWQRDGPGSYAAAGGRVFVGSSDELVALDGASGTAQWREARPAYSLAADEAGVVVVEDGTKLREHDARTGAVRWSGNGSFGTLTLTSDRVFEVTGNKQECSARAVARTGTPGAQLWKASCGPTGATDRAWDTVAGGRFYAVSRVLDTATGAEIGGLPRIRGLAVLPDGSDITVQAGGGFSPGDSYLVSRGPDTVTRWSVPFLGHGSRPVVVGPTVYAVDGAGTLRAFDLVTGSQTWSVPTGVGSHVEITATPGALVVGGPNAIVSFGVPALRSARGLAVRTRPRRPAKAAARVRLDRPVTLRAEVFRGTRRIAGRSVGLSAGTRTVAVTLSARAVADLRRRGTRTVRLALDARAADGVVQRMTLRLQVRRQQR